ncbi:hypothetical protein TrLO_g3932 [Triparma laevis f. longispina]|uniref:Leucine-rich repeat and WD repeat-containing protein 1 LRR domain-containing protein n=1 Tax=Triparma laevis f. longispina TaxID=1714387 RepID=A0A9W7FT82_9STRA|nr:hypothetical protein TrLO_g3932 [Triparma laevis f. longispina]
MVTSSNPPPAAVSASSSSTLPTTNTRMTESFIRNIMETDPNSTPYSLDIHNKGLSHLDNLSTVKKLRSLDISFNKLVDLEGLNPLADLRELKAYSNQIVDVYGICDGLGEKSTVYCMYLETLMLQDNKVKDIPKSFRKLIHLKSLFLSNNDLESISNLPASITNLDLSRNCLTNETVRGLNVIVEVENLMLSGNELGGGVPKFIGGMNKLEELQISDNHVETLQYNLPHNLTCLMANRNHISSQLTMSPLPNLTELHIAGNRITSLPDNLHVLLPKLDLLDVSDNRIDDLRCITEAVSKMKEAMEWWYAIVSLAPQIECLDDMLANSDNVVNSKKFKRRELEIDQRRNDSKGSGLSTGGTKARPKSARRKKVGGAAPAGSPTSTTAAKASPRSVPLVRPPQAYHGREGVFGKLETIDDIESKFGEIKSRLNRCKELTRPDGVPPTPIKKSKDQGEEEKSTNKEDDESPQTAQKKESSKGQPQVWAERERNPGQSRFEAAEEVVKKKQQQPQQQLSPSKPAKQERKKKPARSSLARALSYDLQQQQDKEVEEAIFKDDTVSVSTSSASAAPSSGAGRRKKPKASSMIQNLLKKADQRIKQAQAYSGSTKSHLMPSGSAKNNNNNGNNNDVEAKASKEAAKVKTSENDALEFHPEFEQYEGATLDDYDIGFGFGGGSTSREKVPAKVFNLDDFDESSSEDEAFKIGIAPSSGGSREREQTPESKGDDSDGEGDSGPVDINPFTGKAITFKEEDKGLLMREDADELLNGPSRVDKALLGDGGGGGTGSVPKLKLGLGGAIGGGAGGAEKISYTAANVPLISPRFEDVGGERKAAGRRGAPTLQERKGMKPRLRRTVDA